MLSSRLNTFMIGTFPGRSADVACFCTYFHQYQLVTRSGRIAAPSWPDQEGRRARRTPYAAAPTASTPAPTATESQGRANARAAQPMRPTAGTARRTGAEPRVQAEAL